MPGQKVLDIGCGSGDILEDLPGVDYLGFDINPKCVEAAQKQFGHRGCFFCGDVGLTAIDQQAGSFDLVLATGVVTISTTIAPSVYSSSPAERLNRAHGRYASLTLVASASFSTAMICSSLNRLLFIGSASDYLAELYF
jgi:SAM-dependent methyltransferase